MKPVDKKDLPKLIALIVLAAGVFGFFIMQMAAPPPAASKGPAAAAAAGAANPSAAAKTAGSGGGGSGAAAAAGGAGEAEGDEAAGAYDPTRVVFSPTGRDPFTPNGAAAAAIAAGRSNPLPKSPTVVASAALPPTRLPGNLSEFLNPRKPSAAQPPLPTSPLPSGSAPAAAAGSPSGPVVLDAPPAPDFDVTGVVLGEGGSRSVAILRGADSERRFVMVGDHVGNGFVVSAIHANGIDVRDPSGSTERVVTIKLGNTESSRAN